MRLRVALRDVAPDTTTCDPATGVPVVTFHGTADIVNWYDGGGLYPEVLLPVTEEIDASAIM